MEMIKRLDEIQATLEQRFNQVILETNRSKRDYSEYRKRYRRYGFCSKS